MADLIPNERGRLGLDDFDLHALRFRRVMERAWHGCTDDDIASSSGHKTTEGIARFAGGARQVLRDFCASEQTGYRAET